MLDRRSLLRGAAYVGAAAAFGGVAPLVNSGRAFAQSALTDAERALRKQLMQIPGPGGVAPTDADWQKVGELCLEPTKANVAPGEFKGVQLRFMGNSDRGLHDACFRGFLKSWCDYTGAEITWIDLAQGDISARLHQAISTGTIDFDILYIGAPFEGDIFSRNLASEMPDWVKTQIDYDDYVDYIKAPVGTWKGKLHRVAFDGDTHAFTYRSDIFADQDLAAAWKSEGHQGEWSVPNTWQRIQEVTKFLKGKKFNGDDAYGYLDAPKAWGGFSFYFMASRATAYAKHPDDKAWMFDVDTMKPRINNPAWVRAIQDVIDALPSEPPNQISADPATTGFQQFLTGTGSMVAWWGDLAQSIVTGDVAAIMGDVVNFDITPGSDDVYNAKTGQWDKLPSGPNFAPNNAYIGWGFYVMASVDSDEKKKKAAWSAVAHLGGKDLSLWGVVYPTGAQPYRNSHFNVDEWLIAGYDKRYVSSWLDAQSRAYNHPNAAVEPRIPGIFQYYSIAEDELARIFAGQFDAQTGADRIAAAWEKLTDDLGRDQQIEIYRAALGL
jgi:multiple sugar transport system substrate-binding protein